MTFEDFYQFVDKTLDELHQTIEIYRDEKIDIIEIEFSWNDNQRFTGRESVILEIMDKVYIDENRIYPCVDLHARIKQGILKIRGHRAGFEPRAFGVGWSGRKGPFIYGIRSGTEKDKERIQRKMIERGLFVKAKTNK